MISNEIVWFLTWARNARAFIQSVTAVRYQEVRGLRRVSYGMEIRKIGSVGTSAVLIVRYLHRYSANPIGYMRRIAPCS